MPTSRGRTSSPRETGNSCPASRFSFARWSRPASLVLLGAPQQFARDDGVWRSHSETVAFSTAFPRMVVISRGALRYLPTAALVENGQRGRDSGCWHSKRPDLSANSTRKSRCAGAAREKGPLRLQRPLLAAAIHKFSSDDDPGIQQPRSIVGRADAA